MQRRGLQGKDDFLHEYMLVLAKHRKRKKLQPEADQDNISTGTPPQDTLWE